MTTVFFKRLAFLHTRIMIYKGTSEPAFLLGLRFPFTVQGPFLQPYKWTSNLFYYPLLHFWRNFDERMKFCQTATLWISNCATSWNFKLRLPAKYYTNSQKTNCSNSPINTAFRRGIIHICQLFHCKAYFDKPQTATLNYIFRCSIRVSTRFWQKNKSNLRAFRVLNYII